VLLVSCASSNQFPAVVADTIEGDVIFNNNNTNNNNTNVRQTAPEESSATIIKAPADTPETMYFIGISARKPDMQEALKDAEKDAKIRVSGYIAYMVEEKVEDASAYKTSMGKVAENTERAAIASSSYTRAILSEVKITGEPQITPYRNGTVEVQIVVAVDRKLLDKAIADFNRLRDAVLVVLPIHAQVVFAGDTIGKREQETLVQSIRQGIQNYKTPVTLNTEGTTIEQNQNTFVITLRKTEYPTTGISGYVVTIAFSYNGKIHVKSASKEFKDYSIDFLFSNFIANFIGDNKQFFQEVNTELENNKKNKEG
jgi:hypothetical protein